MARRTGGIVILLGLYIHVPFCAAICSYCNFTRGVGTPELQKQYVQALVSEIRSTAAAHLPPGSPDRFEPESGPPVLNRAADTIYFGGGTPSLLDPEDVARIISACRETVAVAADCEVTLEANPESVSDARLAGYRAAGVNRLSLGVQSFRDDELVRLSRLHGAARARAAVGEARAAAFENVSLDLMMWLPAQSLADWLQSIEIAIELEPDHLSLYLLEVHAHAPLRVRMAQQQWLQAPDEEAAAMYLAALERLDAGGLQQYEIANVAKPGCQSRHNLKYWRDGQWLGFGSGAHSTYDGVRWHNVAAVEAYIARVMAGRSVVAQAKRLSPDEHLGDALFTGLRLTAGVELAPLQAQYGLDIWGRYGNRLAPFVDAGWLRHEGSRLTLSRDGMLVANEVMAVFV